MGTSVMISIQPKWCELIANGKKTIEVRKSRPKLEAPFKCYIYCTLGKSKKFTRLSEAVFFGDGKEPSNGKVVGEFVCDKILDIFISCSDPNMKGYPFPGTGLTDREIMDYLGNGKPGYGWHISDLVIYDTPKELGEFKQCHICEYMGVCNDRCWKPLMRPPQSWCYVESVGVKDGD